MEISQSELSIISKEDEILSAVLESLESQKIHYYGRSRIESERARELTSRIVATRRDEEKAMLASDEAVSHALEERNRAEIKRITKLIKKPYFARIVLEEEKDDGSIKEIEYKIGAAANPDCRIIDWRKAPISKLFYEYREGDEYSEEIQGIERTGRIALRNTVEIENSELKSVSCREGVFVKKDGAWLKSGAKRREPGPASDRMRDVLSLISREQFKTITEDASSAILIQGVAGSGKTTVALHRLAWLLEPLNSDLDAADCLILVQTSSLRTYIENTMPQLGIEGVKVKLLSDWLLSIQRKILPRTINTSKCRASIERVKSSVALLNAIEEHDFSGADLTHAPEYDRVLIDILSEPEKILRLDETRLLTKDLIGEARARCLENFNNQSIDSVDLPLFVRMHLLRRGSIPLISGAEGRYGHIVIDEVQDTSVTELAAVINSVDDFSKLTIVGDTSQNISGQNTFPGWEKLRRFWDHKEEISSFVELKISHRSTLPIMKFADYLQKRSLVTSGREGRVPIWFRCARESRGIESVLKWLSTAMERYPNSLTAVLCANERDARYAHSLLEPSFGNSVRLATHDSFSFEAGIVVSDIKQVKGLEFFNVLLWNPSEKSYPRNESASANLLYVAATRAEENLCIVTWDRPTGLLPNLKSPLVRGYHITEEEESE